MADLTLIRQTRAERGLTVAQLANRAGVSTSAVKDMESGKRTPHLTTLAKVCRVLELELVVAFDDLQQRLDGERESA